MGGAGEVGVVRGVMGEVGGVRMSRESQRRRGGWQVGGRGWSFIWQVQQRGRCLIWVRENRGGGGVWRGRADDGGGGFKGGGGA